MTAENKKSHPYSEAMRVTTIDMIRNCVFGFKCDSDWSSMNIVQNKTSKTAEIRFCNQCQKEVYECSNKKDLVEHIRYNRCIRLTPKDFFPPLMGQVISYDEQK